MNADPDRKRKKVPPAVKQLFDRGLLETIPDPEPKRWDEVHPEPIPKLRRTISVEEIAFQRGRMELEE